jgi:2-polyprenyl-3-methyl-5-hydroxy-6-metoxy-1,4-benzoquinol methylase
MLAAGYRVTFEHQQSHWWYRARRELYLRQVRRAARALGGGDRPLALLDYGCASGFDLPFLSEALGEAPGARGSVEGADITDQFIHASGGDGGGRPIHVVPRDLARLRGRFDIVTCLDVLEHLDDDVDGLRTIASLLAPGGQVVVTVPAYRWLWSGEDEISAHRRRYTRGTLLRACRAAGLEILYASYFNLTVLPAVAATVWTRRLLHPDWRTQSNLTAGPAWLSGALRAICGLEARWVGNDRWPLPAGASLVCRVRRAEAAA